MDSPLADESASIALKELKNVAEYGTRGEPDGLEINSTPESMESDSEYKRLRHESEEDESASSGTSREDSDSEEGKKGRKKGKKMREVWDNKVATQALFACRLNRQY